MAEIELLAKLNEKINSMSLEEFQELTNKIEEYKMLPREQYLEKLSEILGYTNIDTKC